MFELGDVTLTEIVGGGAGGATEPTVPVLHPSVDIAASNAVPMFCRQPWILRPTVLAGTSPMPASESKRSASVDEHCECAKFSIVFARAKRESRGNFQSCLQLERIDALRTDRATLSTRVHVDMKSDRDSHFESFACSKLAQRNCAMHRARDHPSQPRAAASARLTVACAPSEDAGHGPPRSRPPREKLFR
jgi:hypothetical protein